MDGNDTSTMVCLAKPLIFKKFEYLKLFCDIVFCIVNIIKLLVYR